LDGIGPRFQEFPLLGQKIRFDPMDLKIRPVEKDDLDHLMGIEESAFSADRLSRRSMRAWIAKPHRVLLAATLGGQFAGYVLVIHHQGARLGRVYSLAVIQEHRGKGIARLLMEESEAVAQSRGCAELRLEVAKGNPGAIALYRKLGYQEFGIYQDYYENHDDALRMQKRIAQSPFQE